MTERAPAGAGRRTARRIFQLVLVGATLAGLLLPAGAWGAGDFPSPAAAPLAAANSGVPALGADLQQSDLSLAAAASSLSAGQGPARGLSLSCGGAGQPTVTCVPSAVPHPASFGGGSWINVTSNVTNGPEGRGYDSMVYDEADGYVVLFGGIYGTALASLGGGIAYGDTWTYQDGVWTQLNPTSEPGARELDFLAYDPADREVVLFGGETSTGNTASVSGYDDTWVFHAGNWTNLTSGLKVSPPASFRGGIAYDYYDGYLLLFGGSDPTGASYLSDTYKFVGNNWTSLSPTGAPPGRARFCLAYDPSDEEVIAFGGSTASSTTTNDTWAYQSDAWHQVTTPRAPSPRLYYQMATDWALDGVVLYGGSPVSGSGVAMNDTWLFTSGAWTNLTKLIVGNPGQRGYEFLAYDPNGGYFLLFGGYNNNGIGFLFNDTWTFGPNLTAFVRPTPDAGDVGVTDTIRTIATPGSSGLTYSYSGLPTGCASSNRSSIACVPSAAGVYNVSATATNGAGDSDTSYTNLTVATAPAVTSLLIAPSQVDVGIGVALNATAAGGVGTLSYAWGGLPPGCTSADLSTLPCTPTTAGRYTIVATVTDPAGGSGNHSGVLIVNANPTVKQFESSPTYVDLGGSARLWANVSGGTAPFSYVWTNLPAGCAARNESPLPCTPATLGLTNVHVNVTDTFGRTVSGLVNITVNRPFLFQGGAVSPGSVDQGIPVTFYFNVTQGSAPYVYSYSGLPQGCGALPSAAKASCTPTANGSFSITGTATDQSGATLTQQLSLTIFPDPIIPNGSFVVTPTSTDVGSPVPLTFSVSPLYGSGIFNYSYTGLPKGCGPQSIATFSCSPQSAGQGLDSVTVTVKDSWGKTASARLAVRIGPQLTIALGATPSSGHPGQPVDFNASPSGGLPPYTISYAGLPQGCSSQNSSSLSCTPAVVSTNMVEVLVIDSANVTASATIPFNVTSPSSGSSGLLSNTLVVGLALLVVLVVVAAVVLMVVRRRRGAGPPSDEGAPEDATEAAPDDEEPQA